MASLKKYEPAFLQFRGWIATPGEDQYSHRFGGDSWKLIDLQEDHFPSALLLVLDLRDPRLSQIATATKLDELPLVTNLVCTCGSYCQTYLINCERRHVELIEQSLPAHEAHEAVIPAAVPPLPEVPVRLREMRDDELPTNEDAYWSACDRFLYEDTIRVLGAPIWLQDPIEELCSCGHTLMYVSSIGSEISSRFLGGYGYERIPGIDGFFIGEMALYFLLCGSCRLLRVIPQST